MENESRTGSNGQILEINKKKPHDDDDKNSSQVFYTLGTCLFNRNSILLIHHIQSLLSQNCIWRAHVLNVGWSLKTGYSLSRRDARSMKHRTMHPEILARISLTPDGVLSQACLMENRDELYITSIPRGNLSYLFENVISQNISSKWYVTQTQHG